MGEASTKVVPDRWIGYQDKDGNIIKVTCNGNAIMCSHIEVNYHPGERSASIVITACDWHIDKE